MKAGIHAGNIVVIVEHTEYFRPENVKNSIDSYEAY